MSRRRKSTNQNKSPASAKDADQQPSHVFREEPRDPSQGNHGKAVQLTAEFSGPIPHPSLLEGYNQVVPGAAERILKMAEDHSAHQIDMERRAISAARWETHVGQVAAILVTFFAFVAAGYLGYLGHAGAAGTIASTTVVGLATVFITGKRSNKGE